MARLSASLYDVPAPQATLTHPSRANPVKQNTVPTSLRRRLRSPAHVFVVTLATMRRASRAQHLHRANDVQIVHPQHPQRDEIQANVTL